MTFKTQAELFMAQIQNRRRDPVKVATIKAYRSFLDNRILPALGEMELAQIENGTVKKFVQSLSEAKLSASTINIIFNLIKQIVGSAVDENGNQLHPRVWNRPFIDLPTVNQTDQDAPTIAPRAIQRAISRAFGQDKALYALLAGTGLRIGEALALMVGPDDGKNSFWSPEAGTIHIRTTASLSTGDIQPSPKTEAGVRQIDLDPKLNLFLCELLLNNELPRHGLLFRNSTDGPARYDALRDHLKKVGIEEGFHAFRRFRLTHLEAVGVPRGLMKFWAGHAAADITDRYVKIGQDVETRKTWAVKAGLGFQLEA